MSSPKFNNSKPKFSSAHIHPDNQPIIHLKTERLKFHINILNNQRKPNQTNTFNLINVTFSIVKVNHIIFLILANSYCLINEDILI